MGYEADIGLVDPHAEGDGRDDHDAFLPEKAFLVTLACPRFETGMIGESIAPARSQPGSCLVDPPPGEAIDNPGIARMLLGKKPPQLLQRIALGDNPVEQVRSVVASGEDPRLSQPKLGNDVASCRVVRCCGEGQQRDIGKALLEDRELLVFRTEVVTPL